MPPSAPVLRDRLLDLIDRFPRLRLVVLGDLLADEFVYGRVARVSREAPVLMELKRKGVAIDAVAVRDRSEDVADFLARHGDPFNRIGSDPESKVQLALGSSGVPESFIVDGRGIIRYQHMGPIEPADMPTILREWEEAR